MQTRNKKKETKEFSNWNSFTSFLRKNLQIVLSIENDYSQYKKDKYCIHPLKLQGKNLNKYSFVHSSFIDYFVFFKCYKEIKNLLKERKGIEQLKSENDNLNATEKENLKIKEKENEKRIEN